MKQFILIFSFLSFSFHLTIFGQFQQADWMVNGGATFSFNSDGDKNDLAFTIAPRVGHFVLDNFAIGTGITFSYAK